MLHWVAHVLNKTHPLITQFHASNSHVNGDDVSLQRNSVMRYYSPRTKLCSSHWISSKIKGESNGDDVRATT